jgi:hypothetical protein
MRGKRKKEIHDIKPSQTSSTMLSSSETAVSSATY